MRIRRALNLRLDRASQQITGPNWHGRSAGNSFAVRVQLPFNRSAFV
jgi:hypothetical protein